jgi:maltose O-acetyltransferase
MNELLRLVYALGEKVRRQTLMRMMMPLFGGHGKNFRFDPRGTYNHRNIYVGDNVSLGSRPVMLAALSKIVIGNNVMFGSEVAVIGGGHNAGVVGAPMAGVFVKTGNEDLGVVIEDDVWIGARAIILRGVTVGRGSIVGAGSVVTKSVPAYAVIAGNPAAVVRFRWPVETILEHEAKLYKPENRLDAGYLRTLQSSGAMLPPKRNNPEAGGTPAVQ